MPLSASFKFQLSVSYHWTVLECERSENESLTAKNLLSLSRCELWFRQFVLFRHRK